MLRLTRLSLTDFRNYARLVLVEPAQRVVLSGPNGSGKTNLLEAVSLLVPGRGLRGARANLLLRRGAEAAAQWGVAARFVQGGAHFALGTASDPQRPGRRVFELDGAPVRAGAQVAERLAAVWLTPQMDRLFAEGASARRRFLDRLVLALEPSHAREVAAHDAALVQRNRLLTRPGPLDAAWMAALEASLARHAVAVTAARAGLVDRLNAAARDAAEAVPGLDAFPRPLLGLDCPIAARLAQGPALSVEEWLRDLLGGCRADDRAAGTTSLGAQRADLSIGEAQTGLEAALASTGQQKALLIGVILAHAFVIGTLRGVPPLLLLDEPAVHLDATRRAALARALAALPGPMLLTGTDVDSFAGLRDAASFLAIAHGRLDPASPGP